jgi:hypothetical protein
VDGKEGRGEIEVGLAWRYSDERALAAIMGRKQKIIEESSGILQEIQC